MIAEATHRIREASSNVSDRYNPILANALTYEYPDQYYDIIVSQFFLDCFTSNEANDLVARLSLSLKPGGSFSYVDFANPKFQPMKSIASVVLPALYGFFRCTTGLHNRRLPRIDWPDSLYCAARAKWNQGFIVSENWIKPGEN